ncbi:unnamed protein product [Lupinus luteus]|uniref:Uncharacterized protein n=1 Tax=Lupinus luteus TaxID=3873 RepID=A0AAV1W2Y4_LUPLU
MATKGFKEENLIGEGGFGKVVAIKQLNLDGQQGSHEFVTEFRPYFNDRRKYSKMVDPRLQGNYPLRSLHQAIAITAMCLQEDANRRPVISDIVIALDYIASKSNCDSNTNQHLEPETDIN